jgi:hypothetical protein
VPDAITPGARENEALLNVINALETGLPFYVGGETSTRRQPARSQPNDRAAIGAGMRG